MHYFDTIIAEIVVPEKREKERKWERSKNSICNHGINVTRDLFFLAKLFDFFPLLLLDWREKEKRDELCKKVQLKKQTLLLYATLWSASHGNNVRKIQ